jgi:hypothetical protein
MSEEDRYLFSRFSQLDRVLQGVEGVGRHSHVLDIAISEDLIYFTENVLTQLTFGSFLFKAFTKKETIRVGEKD